MGANPEFRLGIIGGCLSHQRGIPLSMIYHRQLARIIQEKDGIRLRVEIARGFGSEYCERLDEVTSRRAVDGLLLHVRVLWGEKASVIQGYSISGTTRYVLHPFLFDRRRFGWLQVKAGNFANAPAIFTRKTPPHKADIGVDVFDSPGGDAIRFAGFRLRSLLKAIGVLVKLDDWGIEDEMWMLARFRESCIEKSLPFCVLGPTPNHGEFLGNFLNKKMNDVLKRRLPQMGIPFCSTEELISGGKKALARGDGVHLTVDGHRLVTNILYDTIGPWIREIVGV